MDDRKRELLERMAVKGLYIADLQAIDEYEQRKKDADAEKEAARNSKDISPLINTAERSTANRARMSEGIQAAADKYIEDNGAALQKLFYGLPSVKEASKTDKGKRDVEKWLAKQLAREGEFYKEILNSYDENAASRIGELRPLTEAAIRKAGRNLANYQHGVRGAGDIRKQELQGYSKVNAQTEATSGQKKAAEADVRKELLEDIAHGGPGKVLNHETNNFEIAPWDVPRDIPPEHRDAVILLMNLFDMSGLAPGSYSPPPSPAEPPVAADPD